MKVVVLLQIIAVALHYKQTQAMYRFGDEPEDPNRIRIFLDDNEKIMLPKNAKIEYVTPIIEFNEDYSNIYPNYFPKIIKKPIYLPQQQFYGKATYQNAPFALEDLKIKEPGSYYGSFIGQHIAHQQNVAQSLVQAQAKQSTPPVALGKLLRPILLLPNGWIQGVNMEDKPVNEERPDDLKYDFRTKTHSLK